MKLDNLAAFQASREFDFKMRPEVKEHKQPEAPEVSQRSVRFQKHQSTDRWMIKVVDSRSNEVIREIPDQQSLDVAAAMKSQIGMMQDTKC